MRLMLLFALCVSIAPAAQAQTPPPAAMPERVLDNTAVRAPGPGLWQVRQGEHTLYVLATPGPLPRGFAWNSAPVRKVIARADAVLAGPSVVVDADIGFFGKLALVPSLMGIRANPGGKLLADVLPAPVHARWTRLKQRHIGRSGGVEKLRPLFAAMELYEEAIDDAGLVGNGQVREAVDDAIKERGLKPIASNARVKVANPKAAVKDFKAATLADQECLEKTMDRVEFDLDLLRQRADAWAAGDVAALRGLRHADLVDVCQRAVLRTQMASKYGMDALEAQARAKWLEQAQKSLAQHRTTFVMLPMQEVLGANGLVEALAAKGYVVQAPDAAP